MQDEAQIEELYTAWCIAEFEADNIYEELNEDFTHPRFLAASGRAHDLLKAFLAQRTKSLRHIFLKLQVACDVEDFVTDVRNPACRDIAPHAVVSAMWDLEALA